MSDKAIGGFSTANLDYIPANPATNEPAHARFHGNISTKLPADWRVERTGMSYVLYENMREEGINRSISPKKKKKKKKKRKKEKTKERKTSDLRPV